MKSSLRSKLDALAERHREVTALLAEPEVIGVQARFRDLSREYAQLDPLVHAYRDYQSSETAIHGAEAL
ncbi:MAG TPA: PCRF domain-containing protein, partial [Gammaproteobacteria bacterium]